MNPQQPQEDGDNNGCGAALIAHVYMEVFFRIMEDSADVVLNGSNSYRLNIKIAMVNSSASALDPRLQFAVKDIDLEKDLVFGENFTENDWNSLNPNTRLSDGVIQFCCKLIAAEHERLIATGRIHDGPIYIFDPLFASSVLASVDHPELVQTTTKFIKESIQLASKIIVPVCCSNHYILLACNPDPITPSSAYSLVYRLHDSLSAHELTPSRTQIVDLISSYLIRFGFSDLPDLPDKQYAEFARNVIHRTVLKML
jgi:hypothetical protein